MTDSQKAFRFNLTASVFDGAFFGLALGFASYVTVLPLFVSHFTTSAILIGLIPAIRGMGWQLPQLLTANRVARLARYKPMVLLMTLNERIPFLGLALIALFIPQLGNQLALVLTYVMLVWHGLGGGLTATAWQSMIAKVIPGNRLGTFFGIQSAAANLMLSLGALGAGFLLDHVAPFDNFALCFFVACIAMTISWFALAQTREPAVAPILTESNPPALFNQVGAILKRDANLRGFLLARILSQFATLASAFYIVFALRHFGMSASVAGYMTSVFAATQVIANPLMGWLGDKVSHRLAQQIGAASAALSALVAWQAPALEWFYLVFILAGIANVAIWTGGVAMTLELSPEAERSVYIGLSNTLIAPSTILAPLIGGWLADAVSYQATFLLSALMAILTLLAFAFLVREPSHRAHGRMPSTTSD